MRDALKKYANDDQIDKRFDGLKAELVELDSRLKAISEKIGDQPLVASHPVYQYLARRYGLNIKAVLWEPETVPDGAAMADLGKVLTGHSAKWMIWEGEPAPESVEKLKGIGVESIVFDPCGNRPGDGDFLSVMEENVKTLEDTFGK